MSLENYLIVTPCKNEEKNLQQLANSVINQIIKPKLWLIFDDGSTDNTPDIIKDLVDKYDWITTSIGGKSKRDLSFHYADIVNTAIKEALKICNERNINIDYIGLIDADMILDLDFFKKILFMFEENCKLGIASGTIAYRNGNRISFEKDRDNLPIGGLRVWRKKCFEETGGYPISYSPDAVSNVLAMQAGWDTRKYYDIIGEQTRKTSSAEGLWKGYKIRGESDYYRDYNLLYVLFKLIKYLLSYPFYVGFAYAYGYIFSILKSKEKISLTEVRKYYNNKHREIIDYYLRKIKSRLYYEF